ncbi:MAG TPA: hypothetical protein VFO70_02065 [Chitinophagaceae bacterium]|nr:hypothetical protein [Chitinophagaceae bacterium]
MKKIRSFLPALAVLFLAISCKEKKKDGKEDFFPAISFIKSQVAHVDTSLYSIIQLNIIDSTRTDTIYVPREQFRSLAKDFLELPDISEKKLRAAYKEEKLFDETLNTVILSYLPEKPGKQTIHRQDVLIAPDPGGDKVKSIIIDYGWSNKDSAIEKKMLWQVDRSFQVTTIRQLPGQEESITTTKVVWNETDNP